MIAALNVLGVLGVAVNPGVGAPTAPAASGPGVLISVIVWLPLLGALAILALPNRSEADHGRIKNVAFAFTLIPFVAALFAFFATVTEISNFTYTGDFKYVDDIKWFGAFGAHYKVGVDGLSLPLVLLSTLLFLVAVLSSWNLKTRVKEYFFLILVLDIGVTGVFTAMDYLLFFVFWEIELIPMFFLIAIWGGPRRIYAAWKFLLFTIAASALLLLGILLLYFKAGLGTFDMSQLAGVKLAPALAGALFWVFFLCFAIKLPAFPLHTWLPDAHVEAPTAISVLLAGILLKMGGYGLIRICAGQFPGAAKTFSLAVLAFGVVGVVWGGLCALAQDDMKRLVAYSSVSHMGFVLIGLSALTPVALNGATFQLFAHGVITGSLFLWSAWFTTGRTRVPSGSSAGWRSECPTSRSPGWSRPWRRRGCRGLPASSPSSRSSWAASGSTRSAPRSPSSAWCCRPATSCGCWSVSSSVRSRRPGTVSRTPVRWSSATWPACCWWSSWRACRRWSPTWWR
jgi:NADH-quinone oxidoreductase subunit M